MKTEFIREKAKSAINFNAFLSPIVGIGLLLAGEMASIFVLIPLSFFLPQGEFTTHVLGLFSFAFISLAVLLWAHLIEKSSWLGLGITKKNAWKDFLPTLSHKKMQRIANPLRDKEFGYPFSLFICSV